MRHPQKKIAGKRTRTPDRLITNQMLYQLSYTSVYERIITQNSVYRQATFFRRRFSRCSHCPLQAALQNAQAGARLFQKLRQELVRVVAQELEWGLDHLRDPVWVSLL